MPVCPQQTSLTDWHSDKSISERLDDVMKNTKHTDKSMTKFKEHTDESMADFKKHTDESMTDFKKRLDDIEGMLRTMKSEIMGKLPNAGGSDIKTVVPRNVESKSAS